MFYIEVKSVITLEPAHTDSTYGAAQLEETPAHFGVKSCKHASVLKAPLDDPVAGSQA